MDRFQQAEEESPCKQRNRQYRVVLRPLLKPIKLSKSCVKVDSKSLVFLQYSLILDILLNK